VTYRPRSSVRKLAKQYFEYGTWRHEVMRRHPETRTRKSALRYYAPPLAVIGIAGGSVAAIVGSALQIFPLAFWGFLAPFGYVLLTAISSVSLIKRARSGALWLPIVLVTMQLSWGIGFLTSRPKSQ